MKVRCTDYKNYKYQQNCFMEECIWSSGGYCAPCPCDKCDSICDKPSEFVNISLRPKYITNKE